MNPSAKCNSFKVGEWKTGLLSTGTGLSLRGLGLFSGLRLKVGFGIRFAGRVRIAEEKRHGRSVGGRKEAGIKNESMVVIKVFFCLRLTNRQEGLSAA